jgi:RNA 3'-terminal phosphate cyclase (ATP)
VQHTLAPLRLPEPGDVRHVAGVALASHLAERRVDERMAAACEARLAAAGLRCVIERVRDTSALHAGASLAIWTETSSGCLLGADQAGARGRASEAIGRYVAETLLDDLRTGATVDRHVADQIVAFAALAGGRSEYLPPRWTDHVETNLWLAERFGATVHRDGAAVRIEGIGLAR